MGDPESGSFVGETDLHVQPGPSLPAGTGVIVRVAEGTPTEIALDKPLRLGSGPRNDIVVEHKSVSRTHAELTLGPDGVTVRDLGSKNGTFYLGQRIGTLTVTVGARIQIGAVTVSLDPDPESLLGGLVAYAGDEYRGLLGRSPRMRKLFALLQRLESSLATVLVEGESGVGKELIARAIHAGSKVSGEKLVVVNCGAIPRELVPSELFGHRRGAFTGAVETRRGAFEQADGGTLFLDEIGELPLDVQPALLRALEHGEIRAVGQDETKSVNVRVIAATNRKLLSEVAEGRFREDLYFRLAVVRLEVPPLRGRPEDIQMLAEMFARQAGLAGLPAPLLEELKSRSWTGNARELRNAVQALAAVGQLPPAVAARAPSLDEAFDATVDPTVPYAEQKEEMIHRFTDRYLKALLAYANGSQAAAARVAGIDRTHLGRLLAKHGLNARRPR